ncbi:hypothetical protein [Rhodobacter calidifons]|uniref:Uncharacterized protein n=1 Tax=Rhodobacter calidifons TaxID=2715277 RepID=A0ABX0G8E3_9RHOB|nr:hypothetical protein [Rhodobacter calidifons]NHB77212.1 hypothetical protein [Rhodobacter calidifons]
MIRLWRMRPILTTAFLIACAVTLFFSGRFVVTAIYWANHQEEPIRPWMTVGYIARSWNLTPPQIDQAVGLPGPKVKGHPQPLSEIARDRGIPVEELIAEIEAAVQTLKAAEAQE